MSALLEFKPRSLSVSDSLKSDIVQSIVKGECSIPEDLVEKFSITYDQAISLLNNPAFIETLTNYSKAKLKLFYSGYASNRLLDIARSEDNRESLQAIKLIAQVSDNLKTNAVDVNINLETMVKESEKNITNVIDILQYEETK